MSKYGLDLEKVENKFNEVLTTKDDRKMADFAKEVIPMLLADVRRVRIESLENLLKREKF